MEEESKKFDQNFIIALSAVFVTLLMAPGKWDVFDFGVSLIIILVLLNGLKNQPDAFLTTNSTLTFYALTFGLISINGLIPLVLFFTAIFDLSFCTNNFETISACAQGVCCEFIAYFISSLIWFAVLKGKRNSKNIISNKIKNSDLKE